LYALLGATDRVHAVQFEAPHNYNRQSREAVYAWMARWLQNAPADVRREETSFAPDPLPDLLVFHRRPVPENALDAVRLTTNWIEAARRQLASTPLEVRARALRQALGFGPALPGSAIPAPAPPSQPQAIRRRTVITAGIDADLDKELHSARFEVKTIDFTPFDEQEAAKIPHFDTYNRTAASQRVADVVDALRASPDGILVAAGDAALAGLFALAIETGRRAVLNVGDFDSGSDAEFVERLYMPGLRRAGDLTTAATLTRERAVIHNAGPRFSVEGTYVRREQLTPKDIVAMLK
jgi:hypothetical protein